MQDRVLLEIAFLQEAEGTLLAAKRWLSLIDMLIQMHKVVLNAQFINFSLMCKIEDLKKKEPNWSEKQYFDKKLTCNLHPDNRDTVRSFDSYDHRRNDARDPDAMKNDNHMTDTSTVAPMCYGPSVDEQLANARNCDAAGKSSNNTMGIHQSSFQWDA